MLINKENVHLNNFIIHICTIHICKLIFSFYQVKAFLKQRSIRRAKKPKNFKREDLDNNLYILFIKLYISFSFNSIEICKCEIFSLNYQ